MALVGRRGKWVDLDDQDAVMPSESDRMWKLLLLLVTLGAEALLLVRLGSRCRAFVLVVFGCFQLCSRESESDC